MQARHYICERCGGTGEIAHHKIHLDRWNVHKPEIALSMENLECLCLACHNAAHGGAGTATAAGLCFDTAGNLLRRENISPLYPPKNDGD